MLFIYFYMYGIYMVIFLQPSEYRVWSSRAWVSPGSIQPEHGELLLFLPCATSGKKVVEQAEWVKMGVKQEARVGLQSQIESTPMSDFSGVSIQSRASLQYWFLLIHITAVINFDEFRKELKCSQNPGIAKIGLGLVGQHKFYQN